MERPLDLDALRTLVAIADSESYARAAEQVHRTQAAVSIQMKRLEQVVGKPLFRKVGRRNVLTNDGRLLATHAASMLRIQHEALSQIRAPEVAGTVRIGVPDSYAPTILVDVLSGFQEQFPQVEIEVHCGNTPNIRHALEKGELDLGICSDLPGQEKGDVLLEDRLVWVTSPSHDTHLHKPVPLALYPAPSRLNTWAVEALNSWERPHRRILSSTNLLALQAAASSGLAVAAIMQSSNTAGLRELSASEGFPKLPAVNVTLNLPKRASSAAGSSLAEHIVERLVRS